MRVWQNLGAVASDDRNLLGTGRERIGLGDGFAGGGRSYPAETLCLLHLFGLLYTVIKLSVCGGELLQKATGLL